ncbi:MAG TPA: hypothetical protein VIW19_13005 [Gaiellaceae bacterium]|jgi:hypothetical protein
MRTGLTTKLFAGLVVVLVAVVATQFASSATSRSAKSISARVKALEKKVKILNASTIALNGEVAALQSRAQCLGAQGVTQYGNPATGQGYIYTNDGGASAAITTAFDAPAQGQTPTFYAATVNPSCVGGSHKAFELAHIASHRTARLAAR